MDTNVVSTNPESSPAKKNPPGAHASWPPWPQAGEPGRPRPRSRNDRAVIRLDAPTLPPLARIKRKVSGVPIGNADLSALL